MEQLLNIKEDKALLRKAYKAIRSQLNSSLKDEYDKKIALQLYAIWAYKEAQTLFIYVATEFEIQTKEIIKHALSSGKKVAVPYCIHNSCEMDFYYISDFDADLERRSFGILEPKNNQCTKVIDLTNGLCIVPALVYDSYGYRLGYGKGYYDRFLNKFTGDVVGFVYSNCVVKELPHGRYDKFVSIIVTEKYVKPTSCKPV